MFNQLKFWKRHDSSLSNSTSTLNALDQNPTDNGSRNPWETSNETKELFRTSSGQQQTQNNQPFNDPFVSGNPFQQQNQNGQQQAYPPTGAQAEQMFQQGNHNSNQESTQQTSPNTRDVELILAKLETIKVSIDNLSHRVDRIEQKNNKTNW